MHAVKHYTELIRQAKAEEEEGELEAAAASYEKAIRQGPLEEGPYHRLMIIYRKLKQPERELKVINKAIHVFTSAHDKRLEKYTGRDKLGQLSRALLKTVSGKTKPRVEYPQPIPRWMKRKEMVEKKIS